MVKHQSFRVGVVLPRLSVQNSRRHHFFTQSRGLIPRKIAARFSFSPAVSGDKETDLVNLLDLGASGGSGARGTAGGRSAAHVGHASGHTAWHTTGHAASAATHAFGCNQCAPTLAYALMQGVWCGPCRYWGPRAEISDHLWRGSCPNVGVGRDPKIPQTLGTRPLRLGERRPLDATTVRQHSSMH